MAHTNEFPLARRSLCTCENPQRNADCITLAGSTTCRAELRPGITTRSKRRICLRFATANSLLSLGVKLSPGGSTHSKSRPERLWGQEKLTHFRLRHYVCSFSQANAFSVGTWGEGQKTFFIIEMPARIKAQPINATTMLDTPA